MRHSTILLELLELGLQRRRRLSSVCGAQHVQKKEDESGQQDSGIQPCDESIVSDDQQRDCRADHDRHFAGDEPGMHAHGGDDRRQSENRRDVHDV